LLLLLLAAGGEVEPPPNEEAGRRARLRCFGFDWVEPCACTSTTDPRPGAGCCAAAGAANAAVFPL